MEVRIVCECCRSRLHALYTLSIMDSLIGGKNNFGTADIRLHAILSNLDAWAVDIEQVKSWLVGARSGITGEKREIIDIVFKCTEYETVRLETKKKPPSRFSCFSGAFARWRARLDDEEDMNILVHFNE